MGACLCGCRTPCRDWLSWSVTTSACAGSWSRPNGCCQHQTGQRWMRPWSLDSRWAAKASKVACSSSSSIVRTMHCVQPGCVAAARTTNDPPHQQHLCLLGWRAPTEFITCSCFDRHVTDTSNVMACTPVAGDDSIHCRAVAAAGGFQGGKQQVPVSRAAVRPFAYAALRHAAVSIHRRAGSCMQQHVEQRLFDMHGILHSQHIHSSCSWVVADVNRP